MSKPASARLEAGQSIEFEMEITKVQLKIDNTTYSAIGPEFTRQIVQNIARAMQFAGFELDLKNPSDQHLELIYNACFNIFVQIEGPNRVTVDGTDYFAHLAFSTERSRLDTATMADDRTILHGEVLTDDLIREALTDL